MAEKSVEEAGAMGVAEFLYDNPILIKHVRSRLRPGQALPWAAVVLVLAACITWTGVNAPWIGNPSAVAMLLGMQILALTFGGSNQINASLGGARETGILDYHRVSPLPPAVVALGFFFGAPIREYALAAIVLPFAVFSAHLVDVNDPWRGIHWFAQLEVAFLMTTWLVQAITMLGCLTRKKPRGSMHGTIVTVIFMLFLSYLGSFGIYFGTRWLLDTAPKLNFFGTMLPWLGWLLIYEVPLLGFLGLAVVRKTKAERTHSYTKRQALACMTTLTVVSLGGLWDLARLMWPMPPIDMTPIDAIMIASVYVFSVVAMMLAVTITPDFGEYVKGLRRAEREGRRRPSPWSDQGSNRMALFALCAIVLAGTTAVVHVIGRPPAPDMINFPDPTVVERARLDDKAWLASRQRILSRPIAIGVLTAAYVGLGLQFFSLRTRRSGLVLTTLFLFLVWLVPMLVGAIIGMGNGPNSEDRTLPILALSPLPGIALSSGFGRLTNADTIQLAALAPPITFAFLFNFLLVVTQRKVDRQVRLNEREKEKEPTKDNGPVFANALDSV